MNPLTHSQATPMVSLVVGSGSVKCAAAIGVVKALNEAGIGIERVVGCSAGALYATMVAFGHTPDESRDATIRLWTKEITSVRNTFGLLRAIAPKIFGFRADNFGLRDDRLVMQRLVLEWLGIQLQLICVQQLVEQLPLV
jgi:NTE family protein